MKKRISIVFILSLFLFSASIGGNVNAGGGLHPPPTNSNSEVAPSDIGWWDTLQDWVYSLFD